MKKKTNGLSEAFYVNATRLTGFTRDQINKILIGHFGNNAPGREALYLAHLKQLAKQRDEELAFKRKQEEDAFHKRTERIKRAVALYSSIEQPLCKVCGTPLRLDSITTWWVCTKEDVGLRHTLAVRLANHLGWDIGKAIETLNSLHADYVLRMDNEIIHYRSMIHDQQKTT